MNKDKTAKPFKVSRWIILSIAVFLNGFIIFYSCLSDEVTNSWSRWVSNIFASLVNNMTHKEVKTIPVTDINASISDNEFNNILGYKDNEIPLGSEKEISSFVLPEDASNKAISYVTEQNDIVKLNQNGSKVSVIGMKKGVATITAYSSDKAINKSINFEVVDVIAPVTYEISLESSQIAIGNPETLNINIDGGATLSNNELLNFQYYDITKLTYVSSNPTVATVDSYGVIYPISTGNSTITVSNSAISKTIDINVVTGTPVTDYTNLKIEGTDFCRENDMILDRTSHSNNYQLNIKDGDQSLNPNDFIWESSNNLLAKVDGQGVLRGFRKTSYEDETVTITATSKKTKQSVSKEILVKTKLPEKIYTCFVMGDKELWNQSQLTAFVGDVIPVKVSYDVSVTNNDFTVELSNDEVATAINEGNAVTLEFKKEGTVEVLIKSNIVTSLQKKTVFTINKAGAIDKDNYESVNLSIRKSIGHATLFAITQIFTFLSFYMFLFDKKKWWVLALFSLGAGIFLASLSEFIQFFIPMRSGTFVDALIDIAGIAVGLGLALGGLFLVKYIKGKKKEKTANTADKEE